MEQQSFFWKQPERREPAAASPGPRNLVIEAGAGTGKTTAIVAEVLKLMLLHEELAPERIVLMTFTEKAAGEIADRIRAALEDLSSELANGQRTTDNGQRIVWPANSPHPLVTIDDPARARRAIAHHLSHIDSLRSQTIHSFCQSLLRSFPLEAGLDPQFKIIEGFERSLLYGQVYDAWVDAETRVNPVAEVVQEWELLFEHSGYLFMIREMILALLERRDLLEETEYDFGSFEEEAVRAPLLDALHAIRNCADEVSGDAQRIFDYIRANTPTFTTLDECLEYLRPISTDIREANLPRKGVLKDALNILRSGAKGRSIYDRLASHRAAIAVVALTRRFVDFLDAEKRKLGVVDFDDLLLRTAAVLDDPTVLARARGQFDYIFVDEFQDTDRTQARIIDRLSRDASGAFVPGRTVVVGDPKQSIYGFRRADPETYYRMTEELRLEHAEPRTLTDQYRSDPPLLESINAMFAALFPQTPHDPNVFRPAYHALTAARPTSRRELDARITLLQARHDDKSDRFFAEAEVIAEWIRAQRDGGERDLQRFAILFRRMTRIDDYLDTLDRYEIPYVLPPTRMFLDRRAPVDLVAVLRAIAFPFDRGAQISAARTPYFGLTDVEIVGGVGPRAEGRGLREETEPTGQGPRAEGQGPREKNEPTSDDETTSEAPRPSALGPWPSSSGPWPSFEAAIARYRDASTHLTVSQLIDLLISTSAIEAVYTAAADGARHLRHLEHVRAIAFEYDLRIGGSVRQFVDEITRRRSEPEEMEPSLVDESQNAVRIMTVHAAKGLEFETVILPDLSVPNPQGGIGLYTVEEPRSLVMTGRAQSISANFRYAADGSKLKKVAAQRDEAETQRLFYVAVTRAMTDVVFVVNPDDRKPAGFLRCLQGALAEPLVWPESGREVRATAIGNVAFERVSSSEFLGVPRSSSEELGGSVARVRRRLADAELEARLASSELVPLEIAVPEAVAERLEVQEVREKRGGARSRAAGILLHRVLELWDGRSELEPLLVQLAREAAAEPDTVARVRKRLSAIRGHQMLSLLSSAETVGRELPIRFVEDGQNVERRIDRLIRKDGEYIVIDYKSGAATETSREKNREQVARYCQAIRDLSGSACRGVIWYVGMDGESVTWIED